MVHQTPARLGRPIAILLAVCLLFAFSPATAAPRVAAVGMTVSNLDRSVAFFTEVLGFTELERREVHGEAWEQLFGVFGLRLERARLALGDERIELTEVIAPRGRAVPADSRSNDLWFQHVAIVVSDMDAAYARLRAHGVEHVSTAPQLLPAWNPDAGGIRAFYFRDADGHNLELIWYPPGKGDPRWQVRDGRLFLGIDHTAIAVADTSASLAFFRDRLGLVVAGTSENHGPEQERLNQVFGARLRITGLKGEAGPGVELLEYLSPPGGRPAPMDLAVNDLAHWRTTFEVEDLDAAAAAVRAGGGQWVSPGVVALPSPGLGFTHGLLAKDPDGHGLLVTPTTRGGKDP